MKRINLDQKWKFHIKSTCPSCVVDEVDSTVDLPHDFSIIQKRSPNTLEGPMNGYFPGGVGIYEKVIYIPEDWKAKVIILELEGVYMNATVHVNHQLIKRHPSGYTSFHCDLTSYLTYGSDNILRITANNSAPQNTRWFSGSGIYRHVWLLLGDGVQFVPWGIYVRTPIVSRKQSTVEVEYEIVNDTQKDTVFIAQSILKTGEGHSIAVKETPHMIEAKSKKTIEHTLTVTDVRLWSIEDPYLYELESKILSENKIIDSEVTSVGIRSISFDAKKGFQLNGITVKLKGGAVHHDCGPLGAASYDRAEERKVELLKENGFNMVRCVHNPPAPSFLNACDKQGMLVIDEVFDCWRESKNINDYGMFFDEWWERDLTSCILRDRNHPSIIMWSTGNEITERDGRSEGYIYAKRLADVVRKLDSTRAVTNAICNISPDMTIGGLEANMIEMDEKNDYLDQKCSEFVKPLDVVGYNYLPQRYEIDGLKYPDRVICGLESFAREAFDYWDLVERMPNVIGDVVWTAIDYIGEAGIGHVYYNGETGFCGDYPWHLAFVGDIDICGFKRPQSYYRDCVWGRLKKPYIAVYKPEFYEKEADVSLWGWPDVVSSWNWRGYEGKMTTIEIYSLTEEVELFINNKSLGRKKSGKVCKYITKYQDVEYIPGEILVIGYEDGNEVSRSSLSTSGEAKALKLTPDRSQLDKTFGDLSFVTVEIIDLEGNIVKDAVMNITFDIDGPGTLIALGTGNPVSEEMYVGNKRKSYEGRVLAIVRGNGEEGIITLTARADGVSQASVVIGVGTE